jgi:hypothetical protein
MGTGLDKSMRFLFSLNLHLGVGPLGCGNVRIILLFTCSHSRRTAPYCPNGNPEDYIGYCKMHFNFFMEQNHHNIIEINESNCKYIYIYII